MPENTSNHNYNRPDKGTQDWGQLLNANFEALDADIELRDAGPPSSNNYDPVDGAKYLDTDTGVVYLADGSSWTETFSFGGGGGGGGGISSLTGGDGINPDSIGNGDTLSVALGEYMGIDNGAVTFGASAEWKAGGGNTAIGNNSTVSGGLGNTASGSASTVGGGNKNTASGSASTVGGGGDNTASDYRATVGGGNRNTASGELATIGGGGIHTASGTVATVSGGGENTASGFSATVGGGSLNTASNEFATVPGGTGGAAEDSDSFVWNDGTKYHEIPNANLNGLSSNTTVGSEPVTGSNTFSVSARNGVRFITGGDSDGNGSYVTYIDSNGSLTAGSGLETPEISGGVTGNMTLTDIAGENLSIENGSLTATGSGGLQSLSGGDGINPSSIDDGDTISVALGAYLSIESGAVAFDAAAEWNGGDNTASGQNSTVAGGDGNTASSEDAAVAGGSNNTASGRYATVSGGNNNAAQAKYTTVAGGGPSKPVDDAQGTNNVVYDNYGTVGGGGNNQAGTNSGDQSDATYATVGGGRNNTASGELSTVAGGADNTASNLAATVAGGLNNTANGGATVGGGGDNTASAGGATVPGGSRGAAESTNSFVWNDGTEYHDIPNLNGGDGLSSDTAVSNASGEPTGPNTFSVSADDGVRFITGGVTNPKVTYIPSDSAGWTTTSTRTVKTNIDPVEPREALAGVESMEVATWEYESEDGAGTTHIGPMAEEFHDAFDVGSSDEHINSINADGVALAAIQGLSTELDETREELAEARDELAEKDKCIAELEADSEQKDKRIADLEARLAAVEDQLGDGGSQ